MNRTSSTQTPFTELTDDELDAISAAGRNGQDLKLVDGSNGPDTLPVGGSGRDDLSGGTGNA